MKVIGLTIAAGLAASLFTLQARAQGYNVMDTVYTPPGYPDGPLHAAIYLPKTSNGIGVILAHWYTGMQSTDPRQTNHAWCEAFAANGYVAMNIDYYDWTSDLRSRYPKPVRACKTAVEFLRRNAGRFGISSGKIVGFGQSEGSIHWGQAITEDNDDAFLGTDPLVVDNVDAAVLLYGAYDNEHFLKSDIGYDQQVVQYFADYPGYLGTKGNCTANFLKIHCPVLLFHGQADTFIQFEQSLVLHDSMAAHQMNVELVSNTSWAHAFDVDWANFTYDFTAQGLIARDSMLAWLHRTLQGVQRRVPQDYATIQAAIDASSDGDTVLVSEGTYRENIRFRGKGIVLGSRFLLDGDTTHIAKTVIDGSGSAIADSGSVVYFIEGEDTTSVLTGFTIRGGSGTNSAGNSSVWGTFRSYNGGGILCKNAGARIVHNIIEKNRLMAPLCYGAGIFAWGAGSSHPFLILQQNQIRDNYVQSTNTGLPQWGGGGGVALAGVEPRVVDNVVERDTVIGARGAYGGGMALLVADQGYYPSGLFARNTIRSNVIRCASDGARGAGMMLMQTGQVTLDSNVFEGNLGICTATNSGWAEGGGVVINDEGITGYGRKILRNNDFIGNSISFNTSGDGAGLQLYCTLATVSGNEFADNGVAGSGTGGGGGISIYQSSFRLENSIFTRNSSRVVGGAIYVKGAPQSGTEQLVVNNTVVDNHATNAAGGMWVNNAPGLVTLNTIFWGDTAGTGGEIYVYGASPTVQYCDVQGGYTGTGNIDLDPKLLLPKLDSLNTGSPCIGAGIAVKVPLVDIHGHPRSQPAWSLADIGAEESHLAARGGSVPPAAAPVPIQPLMNETGTSRNPRFTWVPAANADKYRLLIATDSAIASVVLDTLVLQDTVCNLNPQLSSEKQYYWWLYSGNADGFAAQPSAPRRFKTGTTGVETNDADVPTTFELYQNYPNPFNPKTVVRSQMPVASNVRIVIYDLLGREVKVLVNERRAAGHYEDAFDASGLASGVYVYRLTAGSFVHSKTMLLIK